MKTLNTVNPMTYIDTILADWAGPKVRRTIHLIILLIVALVAIWLGVEGDWKQFVGAVVAAIYAGSNAANTPAPDEDEEEEDDDIPVADGYPSEGDPTPPATPDAEGSA